VSLAPTAASAPPADADSVPNAAFWPALSPADCRASTRQPETVTPARLVEALESARDETNGLLAAFVAAHIAAGITSAADIPDPAHAAPGHARRLYLRACYVGAAALLAERYRDSSAAAVGVGAVELMKQKADQADILRRDQLRAIAELQGHSHAIVDLI